MENETPPTVDNQQPMPQSIYPVPTAGIGAERQEPSPEIVDFPPHKLPWLKVALLGLGTQFALGVLWAALFGIGFGGLLVLALMFGGLENILIAAYFLAIPITYTFLRRWSVDSPFIVASCSMLILFGLHRFAEKLPLSSDWNLILFGYEPSTLERLTPLLLAVGSILAGAVVFLMATFLTNRLKQKTIGLVILLLTVVCVHMGATLYQKPQSSFETLPKVKDLSWKLLPSNLPSWLKEDGYGSSDSCTEQTAHAGYYTCEYLFVNYPGYLNTQSQTYINDASTATHRTDHLEPEPFYWIRVMQDDKKLDAFKYKNEKCDWSGLNDAGTRARNREGAIVTAPNANLRRCREITTPGGKKLVYDSYLNDTYQVQVPLDYYFEDDGNVVLISINYPNGIGKDQITSVYLTDPQFMPELFKFVDSFK